ncbi:hypothetical protein PFISCL1PPCAC_13551, partial [Pristionchus fissidentatus]
SDWHYEISCCRDTIIAMRIVEVCCMLVSSIITALFITALLRSRILHINLRLLLIAAVMNDLLLIFIRVFDIVNVSGLLDENSVLFILRLNSWIFGITVPLTIVLERIYAVRNHISYEKALLYYIQYTEKHAKRIMEVRYRLMENNVASRYQIIEAERSSHMLKGYIPFQVGNNV